MPPHVADPRERQDLNHVWHPKPLLTRAIVVKSSRGGDNLTLRDLVGDGTGRDAWLLGLRVGVQGGGAIDLGRYLEGLTGILAGEQGRLGPAYLWLRDIETFDPSRRCLTRFDREYQQATLDVLRGRKRWPNILIPYRTLRELLYVHGREDYPEPPWWREWKLAPACKLPLNALRKPSLQSLKLGAVRRRRAA